MLLALWNKENPLISENRMIVLAVYALMIAHPGPVFGQSDANIYESNVTATGDGFTEKAEPGVSTNQHNV